MKILTWNINGIRSNTRDKTLKELLDSLESDVICFQETKVTRDMLDEDTCIVEGYNAYFSFSRVKSGYSGVATFCKDPLVPCAAEEGLTSLLTAEPTIGCYGDTDDFTQDELSKLDNEGRTVITEHVLPGGRKVVIINLYCPRVDMENEERIKFKLDFHKLLSQRVEAFLKSGKHVIVLGDINTSHRPVDRCDPGEDDDFLCRPGRAWINKFLVDWDLVKNSTQKDNQNPSDELSLSNTSAASDEFHADDENYNGGLLGDSFRYFYPTKTGAYTNWCTLTGARQTNYGNRIDYIMADVPLIQQEFLDCIIRPEIMGSDHCPVVCEIRRDFLPSGKPPALCTKYMPEFAGKQQKLMAFFTKKTACQLDTHSIVAKSTQPVDCDKKQRIIEGKATMESTKKRPASVSSSTANLNAKRPKKSQPSKQNSIFQFFGQKQKSLSKVTVEALAKAELAKKDSGFSESRETSTGESLSENGCNSSSQESSSSQISSTSGSTLTSQTSLQTASSELETKCTVAAWKNLFKGPAPAPLCPGHSEPSVLRTVKKKGPNYGRKFYCCARPEGHASNKDARCNFFKWVK